MLARFLQPETERFEILSANDEYQALNQLGLKNISLLIIDPQISHYDEYSFLSSIRNEYPGLSIFVVTAFGTSEIQKKIESIGKCRFFEKPLEMDVITQAILQEISPPGVEGRITGLNFSSFIQILEKEKKSCLLKIQSQGSKGEVLFLNGNILSAKTRNLKNKEAVNEMVTWKNITIDILKNTPLGKKTSKETHTQFLSPQNPPEEKATSDQKPEPGKKTNHTSIGRTTGKRSTPAPKSVQTHRPKYSEHYSLTEKLIAQIEKLQITGIENPEGTDNPPISGQEKQSSPSVDPVLKILKSNPNIVTYGIYDSHDKLHATHSESVPPENFKPSVYRKPALSLINQINGGPFKCLMMKNADIHYLLFWYRKKWILLLVNPDFQANLLFEKLLNGISTDEKNNDIQNFSTGLILKDEKMERLLEKLNQTQGIMGSYVLNMKKGVIANKMPPVFTSSKLLAIGKLLIKIYLAGKMSIKEISEITLFYQESVITIRETANQTYVVVLYDPSMRMNHLSTALNMIMGDLRQLAGRYAPVDLPRIKKDIPQEPERKPKSKPEIKHIFEEAAEENESAMIDPDTLISSGPMAGVLQEMQTALTKVIGPIAPVLFTVSLKEWIATDHPDFSTIQGLVDILQKEINDSEKFDAYHKKITPYIWVNN